MQCHLIYSQPCTNLVHNYYTVLIWCLDMVLCSTSTIYFTELCTVWSTQVLLAGKRWWRDIWCITKNELLRTFLLDRRYSTYPHLRYSTCWRHSPLNEDCCKDGWPRIPRLRRLRHNPIESILSAKDSEYLQNIVARDRKHLDAISLIISRRDSKGFSALILRKAVHTGILEAVHLLPRYGAHPIDEELVLSSVRM